MRKIVFTSEQLDKLREMIADNHTQQEIATYFNTTDTFIRKICRESGIELKRVCKSYQCVVCGKEFLSGYKSAICPECKDTPAICIVCGKEFKRISPYTQKTCSTKCRGIYRKESGIAQNVAAKMKATKLERYGTLDPSEVTKLKSGSEELKPRLCAWCGKEFIPETTRQMYCKDIHYGACPVCGKQVEIKDYSIGPQACSEACRQARINATCLEKYGSKYAVTSEHAKELSKQHSLEKYGKEFYSQTDEYKERYKQTSLEKYGTDYPMQNKDVQEKVKQSTLEKYGVENYMQTQEGKDKVKASVQESYNGFTLEQSSLLREKYESTMLERYGVITPMSSPELLEKMKSNNLEKYGTEWAATTDEVNERRKATNVERYGTENPWGSSEIRKKIEATMIEKYGTTNAMYNPEMARITSERQQQAMIAKYGVNASVLVPEIREKMIQTNMERYGVPWYGMSQEFVLKSISKVNKKFAADLEHLGVLTSFEFTVGTKRYDLKVINSNILIEINPTYTHNSHYAPYGDPHPSDYHLLKSKLASENGYHCIHVFDWDDCFNIFNLLKRRKKLYARSCKVEKVDRKTAELFTEKYHLQGSCRGQNIAYGLYYQGDLIQLMSFGKPRYNRHFDLELLRLCTQTGFEVVGGASRLFKHFLKDHPNKTILSYCDYAKFSGEVYTQIGMKLSHMTPPAKVWSKGSKYITDNYLRQRGYDQIFKTNFGKGTSNEQLMLANGWLPVYDCGQKVFTYNS